MSDYFNKIITFVIKNEGGYVNHPDDPGGETNFGITKRYHPNVDIKNLTENDAIEIYKKEFWEKYPFQKINDFLICRKFFDMSVNMGYKQAAKLLQKGQGKLLVDGVIGPMSLSIINADKPEDLLVRYKSTLAKFYRDLANQKSTNEKFLDGWLRRAYL